MSYQPGLVLLESKTASSSASLAFTNSFSSSYDTYMIQFVSVKPATNNQALLAQVSTNGGSSYISTGTYRWGQWRYASGAQSGAWGGSNTDTSWHIDFQSSNSASAPGLAATVWLSDVLNNPAWNGCFTEFDGSNYLGAQSYGSTTTPTTGVNAIQFLFASGNIASGTIRIYGLAK